MDSLIHQRLVAIAAALLICGATASAAQGQGETPTGTAPAATPVTRLVTYAARCVIATPT
jgi:hypothetical protein